MNKNSTEIDMLPTSIVVEDLDNIFQAFDNFIYLQERKQKNAEIEQRVKKMKEKQLKELNTLSDLDVLETTVRDWVRMSGSTTIIEYFLKQGEKDKACREFHRMINESGSSGRMISFMKIYKTIEIKTLDGRLFHPTEKELWDIYYSLWKVENEFNLFNLVD